MLASKRSSGSRSLRVLLVLGLIGGCGGLHGDPEDLGDLIFGIGGSIPRDKLGVQNEFVPTPKGDAAAQGDDISNTIGLRHIRTSFFFRRSGRPSRSGDPQAQRRTRRGRGDDHHQPKLSETLRLQPGDGRPRVGHARDVFPALDDQIDRLDRIYIFTYFDGEGPPMTYGLVANDGLESDLYQFLRDG
jgi:hypothetical protein